MLHQGTNNVLVQTIGLNGKEVARATMVIWYDDTTVQTVSGAIAADTTWTAASGPYQITGNLTVNSGATLTILPGTTVYLNSGVTVTVANGGRLLAEGTATDPILFTRPASSSTSWSGMTINGGAGSPETRIVYARFEFNASTAIHSSGGTVFLNHLSFGNPAVQYVSLDSSSFVVSECVFPSLTAAVEPVHGKIGRAHV